MKYFWQASTVIITFGYFLGGYFTYGIKLPTSMLELSTKIMTTLIWLSFMFVILKVEQPKTAYHFLLIGSILLFLGNALNTCDDIFILNAADENWIDIIEDTLQSIGLILTVIGLTILIKHHKKQSRLLLHLAKTDPLTGLDNRLSLINTEDDSGKRHLILLDIDRFKLINDHYGHLCGDHVLVEIAKRLREQVRMTDRLVRWGGEEFLIALYDLNDKQALKKAEAIRSAIKATPIVFNGKPFTVTVSIGLVSEMDESSLESAIALADQALYQAKADGRDCVRTVYV